MTRLRVGSILLHAFVALALLSLAANAEDVTLRLKWLHGAQFAGYYAAIDQGFYADENLVVHLLEGATDYQEYQGLADGVFDFLVGDTLRLLQAVDNSIPVQAIAAVYQFDPLVLFSLAEREIVSPFDLSGKHIMGWNSVLLEALITRTGMAMSDVGAVSTSYNIEQLWDGTFDVWMGYLTNEVIRTRDAGFDINIIYPTDYGVHIYGDALVTRTSLIDENPDLVLRFVRASLRGWEYVSQNVDNAASLSLAYDPQLDPSHEAHAVEASLPLLHGGVAHIGWMDERKWWSMANLMHRFGRTTRLIDPAQVFTTQFLDAIYHVE